MNETSFALPPPTILQETDMGERNQVINQDTKAAYLINSQCLITQGRLSIIYAKTKPFCGFLIQKMQPIFSDPQFARVQKKLEK